MESASNWRATCLYASWRRRDAWRKTLFSDNAGWEIHCRGISECRGTPSLSAEASITVALCSSSVSATISVGIESAGASSCIALIEDDSIKPRNELVHVHMHHLLLCRKMPHLLLLADACVGGPVGH
jgi:hypothetical protein